MIRVLVIYAVAPKTDSRMFTRLLPLPMLQRAANGLLKRGVR